MCLCLRMHWTTVVPLTSSSPACVRVHVYPLRMRVCVCVCVCVCTHSGNVDSARLLMEFSMVPSVKVPDHAMQLIGARCWWLVAGGWCRCESVLAALHLCVCVQILA